LRRPSVWKRVMDAPIRQLAESDRAVDLEDDVTGQRILAISQSELDRAYRLAGLVLGGSSEAEDATQEALLRAWRQRSSLRDASVFRPWFDRILVNVCRDRLRRRARITFVPLDATGPHLSTRDPFEAIHARSEMLAAMRRLTTDQRIVVVLHYWADLTLEDVALRTSWPIGTVKSRLHSALAQIRRELAAPAFQEIGND
jgi:RNA polymerase sigma-70 factor (ECF subfamily)